MRPKKVIVCLLSGLLAGCASSSEIEVGLSSRHLEGAGYSTSQSCAPDRSNPVDFSKHFLSINNRGQYQPVIIKSDSCSLDANGETFEQAQEVPACLRTEEGCNDGDEDLIAMHLAIDNQINTILDEVYSVKNLAPGNRHHLIIFIHGGLNNHTDSVQRGIEQLISMQGFEPGKNIPPRAEAARGRYATNEVLYPLFINWPSGLFDAYFDKTFNYTQGQYDTSFQKIAGPLFFIGNIGETIARAPANYAKSTQRWVATLRNDYRDAANKWSCDGNTLEKNHFICSDEGRLDHRVTRWIPYGLTFPARLITTPMIDPYGKAAWDGMLARTRLAFYRPLKPNTPNNREKLLEQQDDENNYNIRTKGVLWHFFNKLQDRHERSANPIEITIVAHSMGAIISNEIIRLFPDLPYKNIVYMGAASSIRDFRMALEPLLASDLHSNVRFYNLSLHPFAEVYEINRGGLSPMGSLLEWIDDIYTTPLTYEDRTLGKWLNVIMASNEYSRKALQKMTFKRFGLSACSPLRHGDFDQTSFPAECPNPNFYWDPVYWVLQHRGDPTVARSSTD